MNGPLRMVLLGKTGCGKSSLGNTITGKEVFRVNHFSSEASCCQKELGKVIQTDLSVVDTPGLFHPEWAEQQLRQETIRCISECAPGPHAFLIVLKVEKFTEQEVQVISVIQEYFSPDVFKHCVVVFTYGNQLSEEMSIQQFIQKNRNLNDLVAKCGGRCHVFDNKYWKPNQQEKYRNNQVQVAQLIGTIQKMVQENNGGFYSPSMLASWQRRQAVIGAYQRVLKFTRRNAFKLFVGVTLTAMIFFLVKRRTHQPSRVLQEVPNQR